MKKNIELKKRIIIFIVGFFIYLSMEVMCGVITKPLKYKVFVGLFSMGLLGGILLNILGAFNEIKKIKEKWNLLCQCLLGAFIITLFEFITGCILNLWLNLNVWDYSHHVIGSIPLNILGQVSILYSLFWFILCPFSFWVDDVLRWAFYKTGICNINKSYYSLGWLYKQLFSLKPIKYGGK